MPSHGLVSGKPIRKGSVGYDHLNKTPKPSGSEVPASPDLSREHQSDTARFASSQRRSGGSADGVRISPGTPPKSTPHRKIR